MKANGSRNKEGSYAHCALCPRQNPSVITKREHEQDSQAHAR